MATALVYRAGRPADAVFVDTGMLRLHEREQVEEAFRKYVGVRLSTVNGIGEFPEKLQGVTDPSGTRHHRRNLHPRF